MCVRMVASSSFSGAAYPPQRRCATSSARAMSWSASVAAPLSATTPSARITQGRAPLALRCAYRYASNASNVLRSPMYAASSIPYAWASEMVPWGSCCSVPSSSK
jgi:hypothetical protein